MEDKTNDIQAAFDKAEKFTDESEEKEATPFNPRDSEVQPLGFDEQYYYNYSTELAIVVRLRASGHSQMALLGMARESYWASVARKYDLYTKTGGISWLRLADSFFYLAPVPAGITPDVGGP